MTLNFDKKPPIKCASCGKPKGDHHSRTAACPIGSKHRVFGYTQFSGTSFFYSDEPQNGSAK